MLLRDIICCFFLFVTSVIYAQSIKIKGLVLNDSTNNPIQSASVFFSNTSWGTTTDAKGQFELDALKQNAYMLIISCVGYNTFNKLILIDTVRNQFVIRLKTKRQPTAGYFDSDL